MWIGNSIINGDLNMYEYFHPFCPFFHLSGCPAQSSCKAGEQEPEVMHFLRAGVEHRISNLLRGANTQKCSTVLLTSRAAELPMCLGKNSFCFHNGKILSEVQIFGVQESQPHTRACPEVWGGACKHCASLAAASLLSVLPLLSSPAHLRATPETKQLKALQRAPGWSAC